MDAATARGYVQRDLKDESAVRWTANEIDRAVNRALAEYSLAWPTVTYTDKTMGSTDTIDCTATTAWLYGLWAEYPTGENPPEAIRIAEERRGYVRIVQSSLPAAGETVRIWYAKTRAIGDVESEHEVIVCQGAAAFAALAGGIGSVGVVTISGWTPKQYQDWGRETLADFRRRLKGLADAFSWGAAPAAWSSAEV